MSKTQIDRLGDRLKSGPHTESDLELLDEYRRSFSEAYQAVIQTLRERGETPTGRLAKSTMSIVEKLRRESIRLSQMQDIAGCRIVVPNVVRQDQLVASLKTDFPQASVIDRRDSPSHGYRAVHIVVEVFGKPIEIQVRSRLQHLWAELSEKASDVFDPTIKYGGGPEEWRDPLADCSEAVAAFEKCEKRVSEAEVELRGIETDIENLKGQEDGLVADLPDDKAKETPEALEAVTRRMEHARLEVQRLQGNLASSRNRIATCLGKSISLLNGLERRNQ